MFRVPERFSTEADVPLPGDVDLPAILSDVPRGYSLKGMFFARFVGEAWPVVEKDLDLPPPSGKYHAFESYPLSDYIRVFDRIARARFPGSTREAYRLLARGEVEVFAATTLGKVTFSMLRDPEVALERYPELFGVLSKGPVVHAERTGPKRIGVTYQQLSGSTEYIVGVLEGLAMAFDVVPSLDVDIDASRRAVFTVRW
jgi:uncharacterized protein (TIGR02265 family)